jgi:dCMP deaminase
MERPDKDNYYLDIARVVGKRSPCSRRHVGAVVVKNDSIISTGYNGSARGVPNCIDHGCLKDKYDLAPGGSYDLCRAGPLHGEVNAIINAARGNGETIGGTLYIAAEKDGNLTDACPCTMCKKVIINAGLEKVIVRESSGGVKQFEVKDWVEEAKNSDDKDVINFYK